MVGVHCARAPVVLRISGRLDVSAVVREVDSALTLTGA